jgi:hypothetical protein
MAFRAAVPNVARAELTLSDVLTLLAVPEPLGSSR